MTTFELSFANFLSALVGVGLTYLLSLTEIIKWNGFFETFFFCYIGTLLYDFFFSKRIQRV
jgi:hypothetical protein